MQDHGERMDKIKKQASMKGGRNVDELIQQQIARLQHEAEDAAEAEQVAYRLQMDAEREKQTRVQTTDLPCQ